MVVTALASFFSVALFSIPEPAVAHEAYVVQQGDTVTRIARRAGVSWRSVVDANGLVAPYVIRIGASITIPGAGSRGGSSQASTGIARAGSSYRVLSGDTLTRIGRRSGVPWRSIAAANGITGPNYMITIGRSLAIPEAGALGGGGGAGPTGSASSAGSIVVAAGDTLERIGRRSGLAWRSIAELNAIKGPSYLVRIGQVLRLDGAQSIGSGPAASGSSPAPRNATLPAASKAAIEQSLEKWSERYGLPTDLVRGLAWVESGWQAQVVSSAGAKGVMQLMPGTARWLSETIVRAPIDRANYDDNIRGGTAYLRWLLDQTGQDERLALASYYQGLGAVRRHGLYAESEIYVAKVQGARRRSG